MQFDVNRPTHPQKLYADGEPAGSQVVSFLGLPAASGTVMKAMEQIIPAEVTKKQRSVLPEARQKLLKFYKPFNDQLHKLVTKDAADQTFLDWNL